MNLTRWHVLGLFAVAVGLGVVLGGPAILKAARQMDAAGFSEAVEADLARLTEAARRRAQ